MTLGFINSGIPFGSTISFLIASPLLNPIIIGMFSVRYSLDISWTKPGVSGILKTNTKK
jgi:uncharacterized membrane protein YraQ (UPF0718 family)